MERYILVDTLKQYPLELERFAEAQDDDELVRIAVKKNGLALQFASQRLRDDYETVMRAVRSNGKAYEFASETLRDNTEIVIAATSSSAAIIELIPERHLSDERVARNLVKLDPCSIGHFINDESLDTELIKLAVKGDTDACMYLPQAVWDNKQIVMSLVAIDSFVVRYASENTKIDKDIALAAMKGAGSSWGFRELPLELQRDADVIRAFASNPDEEACEGIICNIALPQEALLDDAFIRNVVDYCSCCEQCGDCECCVCGECGCIWKNETLNRRAKELCNYVKDFGEDELSEYEDDSEDEGD